MNAIVVVEVISEVFPSKITVIVVGVVTLSDFLVESAVKITKKVSSVGGSVV